VLYQLDLGHLVKINGFGSSAIAEGHSLPQ
jgi:hypothetical protein